MTTIEIDIDYKTFEKQLDQFGRKSGSIARRMMQDVSRKIKSDAKKNVRGLVLKKQTGALGNSIGYTAKNNFTGKIYASAYYASTAENGAHISPRRGKYLVYKIGDQWIRSKSVTVPAHPFLLPVIEMYFGTSKAEEIMDATLQRAINQIFKDI